MTVEIFQGQIPKLASLNDVNVTSQYITCVQRRETWEPHLDTEGLLSRCQQAIFGSRQICSLINQIFSIFPGNKHIALEQIISLAQQCKKEWKRKVFFNYTFWKQGVGGFPNPIKYPLYSTTNDWIRARVSL